jgi:glutathione synthase/RimK-type ligase-like ATP-grasp enzyme
MKKLIILTDEDSTFLISRVDLKNYTTMDIDLIRNYFISNNFTVNVFKFSELDLSADYNGIYILYQTSELPGSFYKRYIEDLICFLERQGAIALPKYEYLKAHHNKIYMELLRSKFSDEALKTIKTVCYGSWVDAKNFDFRSPVVIKQASSSGSAGVYLARTRSEYVRLIKKAGKLIIGSNLADYFINYCKTAVKNLIKYLYPSKSRYLQLDTTPISNSLVIQDFIEGLKGDYKVLIYGEKYYTMFRKNRSNDFRASGSGEFFTVDDKELEGLFTFARKIVSEIDFPIFGIDVGFDGKKYHLIEYQMLGMGTSALQRSQFWHEFHDGKWVRYEGKSILEVELARAICDFISVT